MLLAVMGWVFTLAALTGCMEADHHDLHVWVDNERARIKPTLSAPHPQADDEAPVYRRHQGLDPFSRQRLLRGIIADDAIPVKTSSTASILGLPPLEASPLVGMRLVGSLQKGHQPLALLLVNGRLYPVRVGDKLGQDQGRVSAITLTELVLREVAIDSEGQTTVRVVHLALVSEP